MEELLCLNEVFGTSRDAKRKGAKNEACQNEHERDVGRSMAFGVSPRWRSSCRSLLVSVLVAGSFASCDSFVVQCQQARRCHQTPVAHLSLTNNNVDDEDRSEIDFMDDLISRAEEIQVERERGRLEEANTQAFLKRKPRKLPYEDARRWIQANLGPDTKEEFLDLVENGNLRTPYIPKRPEEYYTETREWISWDHFLTGIFDKEQPSAVRPLTGIFD